MRKYNFHKNGLSSKSNYGHEIWSRLTQEWTLVWCCDLVLADENFLSQMPHGNDVSASANVDDDSSVGSEKTWIVEVGVTDAVDVVKASTKRGPNVEPGLEDNGWKFVVTFQGLVRQLRLISIHFIVPKTARLLFPQTGLTISNIVNKLWTGWIVTFTTHLNISKLEKYDFEQSRSYFPK